MTIEVIENLTPDVTMRRLIQSIYAGWYGMASNVLAA
jgi:hypothetical protein